MKATASSTWKSSFQNYSEDSIRTVFWIMSTKNTCGIRMFSGKLEIKTNLSDKIGGVLFGVGALCDNAVEELSTRDELHDKVHELLLIVCVEELDYVRVPQSANQLESAYPTWGKNAPWTQICKEAVVPWYIYITWSGVSFFSYFVSKCVTGAIKEVVIPQYALLPLSTSCLDVGIMSGAGKGEWHHHSSRNDLKADTFCCAAHVGQPLLKETKIGADSWGARRF